MGGVGGVELWQGSVDFEVFLCFFLPCVGLPKVIYCAAR